MTIPIKKADLLKKTDFARGSKINGITLEFNERTNPAPIEAEARANFSFLDNMILITL
jgi:hypothetical protein